MDLQTLITAHGGQAKLAEALGVNKSYVNRAIRGGLRPALAIRIYRKWGHKLGPIEGATGAQIEAIERVALRRSAEDA
jgi:DNA-binding transcriptional regulator YdaS (Cro superfamily)